MKNGGTPCSDFVTAAGPLASFALTGHLAMFAGVGKKIEWDVEKMECTNLPEANQYARREYRAGWEFARVPQDNKLPDFTYSAHSVCRFLRTAHGVCRIQFRCLLSRGA